MNLPIIYLNNSQIKYLSRKSTKIDLKSLGIPKHVNSRSKSYLPTCLFSPKNNLPNSLIKIQDSISKWYQWYLGRNSNDSQNTFKFPDRISESTSNVPVREFKTKLIQLTDLDKQLQQIQDYSKFTDAILSKIKQKRRVPDRLNNQSMISHLLFRQAATFDFESVVCKK